MELKTVTVKDGIHQCDIGISVEEWQDILLDESLMNDNYSDVLMKFYAEPEHRSTCKQLGEKYGVSPQSFNITITNFAKAVQKKLNRFKVVREDGETVYWIIPMIGRPVGEHFEWTLREELVNAINKNINDKYQMDYFDLSEKSIVNFLKEANQPYNRESEGASFYYDTRKKLKYLGFLIGERIGTEIVDNYDERPDRRAGRGKKPNLRGYVLNGFIPKQYYDNIQRDLFIKVAFHEYNNDFLFEIELDINFKIEGNKFHPKREQLREQKWSIPIRELPDNWNNLLNLLSPHFQRLINYLNDFLGGMKSKKEMNQYIQLLKTNKNLIFTGAPGTGKTYLTKQIALSMLFEKQNEEDLTEAEQKLFDKHFCFVQFHPSYDYTDFVEGLRTEDLNGQVMFSLHNGIFKSFCKNAIQPETDGNFDELYDQFLDDISENDITFETPTYKKQFRIEVNSRKTCVAIPSTVAGTRMSVTKDLIRDYVINDKITDWKPYTTSIGNYFKEHYPIDTTKKDKTDLPYIFIIDEINRGEISKIFGELFFSIDPGYRGKRGKVKTQYANMQSGETIFDDELGQGWFYVPENVYIIGTMNDIDRSVESMDFAMRRRFAWKAIKAEDRIGMWYGQIDDWKEVAEKRMKSLNEAIEQVQGLGTAYHVGPAYFLKLNNYKGDFDALWNNHLEGLLFEYLRGMPDAEKILDDLKSVYNQPNQTNAKDKG